MKTKQKKVAVFATLILGLMVLSAVQTTQAYGGSWAVELESLTAVHNHDWWGGENEFKVAVRIDDGSKVWGDIWGVSKDTTRFNLNEFITASSSSSSSSVYIEFWLYEDDGPVHTEIAYAKILWGSYDNTYRLVEDGNGCSALFSVNYSAIY